MLNEIKRISLLLCLCSHIPLAVADGDSPAASGTGHADTAKGIDVSHFQGEVDWAKVKQAGITFTFVKATGGDDYTDPHFDENWAGSGKAGLFRGAYHFFYANDDALGQAKHFINTVKSFPRNLPPVVDVEVSEHVDKEKLVADVLVWLDYVRQTTGCTPIIYTDPGFGDHYFTNKELKAYPLWIADYATRVEDIPSAWWGEHWTFWQYTQTGEIAGVNADVDRNRFNGTPSELKKHLCKKT